MASIEEYPFIFMNTPASLQSLASAEIAVILWRYEYFGCKGVLAVPVPRRIEAQINEKLTSISYDMDKWIPFHLDHDFLDTDYAEADKAVDKYIKHIVVDFSGSVGYKASALNMLNSSEFRDVVNYKIACTFCLEDQVKRFWPSVVNESRIDVNSEHDKWSLSYWNGRMKSGGNSITDTESVRRLAKEAACWRNDTAAFDYFCKMLPDHERVSEFIALILDDERCFAQRAVIRSLSFHTLNRVSAEEMFKSRAGAIFDILCSDDHYYLFTHELWAVMRHLVLENEQRFCNVMIVLSRNVGLLSSTKNDFLNYAQCHQISDLLSEIWSHASDELKANVSDTFLRDNLISLRYCPVRFFSYYGHDMTFLLELLSKWRDVDREQLWRNNWHGLVLYAKPLYLQQLVRMCLPNEDAIELFKNEFANFDMRFTSLIRRGFYSDLKDDLIFCSKDTKQFQELGRKVLESNFDVIFRHDHDDKLAKFNWFVGEIFANVQKDIAAFKMQMISSAGCLKQLLDAYQSDRLFSSNDLSRVVSRFISNEEQIQQVKHKLFKHCRAYPLDYKGPNQSFFSKNWFNADQWQEFLEWCTDDRDEIAIFKRSLNMDVIFQKSLRDYLSVNTWDSARLGILRFLDGFLKWYCGNEKDTKNFKLDKIKNYKQIDFLRVEMEKKCINDISSIYKLLMWFFDDTVESVREFCKNNLIILSSSRK